MKKNAPKLAEKTTSNLFQDRTSAHEHAYLSVLDTSAILALIKQEIGVDEVNAVLHLCVMSSVNYSELQAKCSDIGIPTLDVRNKFGATDIPIIDFDQNIANLAGELRPLTRKIVLDSGKTVDSLSFADRACLATARRLGFVAITADTDWKYFNLDIPLKFIR